MKIIVALSIIIFSFLLLIPVYSQTNIFSQANLPFKSCFDKVKNGNEADIDCGGSCKKKCEVAQFCYQSSDCESGYCNEYSLCEQIEIKRGVFNEISTINPLIGISIFLLAITLVIIIFYLLVKLPHESIKPKKPENKEQQQQPDDLMENPLEQSIIKLYYSGLSSNQIAQQLQEQGFSKEEITDSFNQLKEKLIALQGKKNSTMPQ